MIKTGKVSSINRKDGTVQVVFGDQDDMVSADLPMLSHLYDMPDPDDQVLCIFADNASQQGFCLGRFYCDAIPGADEEVVRWRAVKDKDDSFVEWDANGNLNVKNNKADMTIDTKGKVIIKQAAAIEITTAADVKITCATLSVSGDVDIKGSIHASGSIMDDGGNTNHHAH